MNSVLIFTDTQCKRMVSAYGEPVYDTPNLDRLAATGVRFERAYTACPVCTPARGALYTGLYPSLNGAWANDLPVYQHVPMLGGIVRQAGCRAAHTGKWHLDGAGYNGTGIPDGGFEPDWWYDRANLLADLPPHLRGLYRLKTTADDLRRANFQVTDVYGHRVADRAIDFLERVGDDPFVLVVSFDEPHDPWIVPPEWWEKFHPGDLPARPNYRASTDGKPRLQQLHAQDIERIHGPLPWDGLVAKRLKYFGCNSFIDREIGRVIDAIERLHGDDTAIIYTADHGDQLGSHGIHDKGAFMYEETTNIPFIARMPGGAAGAVSQSVVSHLDVLPTMLTWAGVSPPRPLPGVSLVPALEDPSARVRDHAVVSFNRFQVNGDGHGGFFPIRCITDGRWKLAINLVDIDELYDLDADPYELTNRINDPSCASVRDALHDRLLAEIEKWQDPMRNWLWGDRPWRKVRSLYYIEKSKI